MINEGGRGKVYDIVYPHSKFDGKTRDCFIVRFLFIAEAQVNVTAAPLLKVVRSILILGLKGRFCIPFWEKVHSATIWT